LCTESGKNLLPIIKELLPDMIFLDVFLQGEDGREICKELRNNSETKYLCIILISGSPKDLELYKEFGADGYLEKPFGLPVLLDKIESTLGECKDK
jgi:CheY-like chemotaxis protein